MERVTLMLDGNAGCALLGENLQEGEAEFVTVTDADLALTGEGWHHYPKAAVRACHAAYDRLLKRLGYQERALPYAWYPRSPWSSGA